MYGIFTYIWVIFRANVGKYSIHAAYGKGYTSIKVLRYKPHIVGDMDRIRSGQRKKLPTSKTTSRGMAGMGQVGGLIRFFVAVDVMTLYEISALSNSLYRLNKSW